MRTDVSTSSIHFIEASKTPLGESNVSDIINANFNCNQSQNHKYPKTRNCIFSPSSKESTVASEQIQLVKSIQLNRKESERNQGKSPGKSKWKKVANIIRSVTFFKSHETNPIESFEQLDEDLKDYQSRLLFSTKQSRELHNQEIQSKCESKQLELQPENREKSYDNIEKDIFDAWTSVRITNTKLNRENMKEYILDLIRNGEGSTEVLTKIDEAFKYNPDKDRVNESHPNYIFNSFFPSGKNLFYYACQEGKIEIVQYFLKHRLNPKIKSKVDVNTEESPWECVCRWNYINIVNLLLRSVIFTENEIKEALRWDGLSKSVIYILKQYLSKFSVCNYTC